MTSTRLASLARAGRLILSLLALILATITAHEAAHIALALALKVPLASFTWFDPHYLAPVLVSGPAEKAIGMTVVDYAGGLVAGGLLLAILVLRRDWFKRSNWRWLLGCYVAALGLWEVCQGVLEGAFHEMYVSGVAGIFSPACCAGYASALLGVALYCMAVPRPAVAGIPQAG